MKSLLTKKRISIGGSIVTILALLIAASCANNNEEEMTNLSPYYETAECLQQLIVFNRTIKLNSGVSRSAAYDERVLTLITADAQGAYEGSKAGRKLGDKYCPNEQKFGAEIGGAVIGAAVSYKRCIELDGGKKTYPLSNRTNASTDKETFAAGYVSARESVHKQEYAKGISWGLDSCSTKVGILHNKVLDKVEYITLSGIQKEQISRLNPSERQLVESEEFKNEFLTILSNSNSLTEPLTISDQIMDLFVEAVSKATDNQRYIERIIAHYTDVVKKSKDLSAEDKQSLCIGFAVMGYSYDYWSKVYALAEKSEDSFYGNYK